MIEWLPAWKVCFISLPYNSHKKRLVSVTTVGHVMDYDYGIVTDRVHGCGPLTAFRTRELAERFHMSFQDQYMLDRMVVIPCAIVQSEERSLWSFNKISNTVSIITPVGTLFADKIMLLPEDWS
jgi:hypothetical protein